jgi:hypothetical protein
VEWAQPNYFDWEIPMTTNWKTLLDDEVLILKQARDELKVQIHLGASDAQDTWEGVEKNWEHLEARLKRLGQVAQESAGEVEDAAQNLVDEIKAGYKRIRTFL